MPMTNLLGLPVFLSTESATTPAMTAPTKPTPMTTTISRPALRWAATRVLRRSNSAAYSSGAGRGKDSPLGETE